MLNKLILDQNLNGGLKIIPPERHGSGIQMTALKG
jgi:hypothetical protein